MPPRAVAVAVLVAALCGGCHGIRESCLRRIERLKAHSARLDREEPKAVAAIEKALGIGVER